MGHISLKYSTFGFMRIIMVYGILGNVFDEVQNRIRLEGNWTFAHVCGSFETYPGDSGANIANRIHKDSQMSHSLELIPFFPFQN